MTDINPAPLPAAPAAAAETFSEEALRQGMELLFYAYRDFVKEPDALLARYGFGRAHHRALYFIGRNPTITVGELTRILRITKQSLARVLNQLVERGFVVQVPGTKDRRQRLLQLTRKGGDLEHKLFESQRRRMIEAFSQAGPQSVAGFRKLLAHIIDAEDIPPFAASLRTESFDHDEP